MANRLHKRKPAAEGIFIAQVHGLGDNPLPAVASLGKRPTVDDSGRYLLEVHIFNFHQTVYGKLVQIELIQKIRDEEKYNDLETLKNAIHADAMAAKNYFEITDHV
jgi:riboflavin kinase/FMN adenylyltransferase